MVRFINDILLSAPSIVVGLFVYELLVVPVGHFSALAGGVALAMLGAPIMVRTTEDMLNLVPDTLREAASALGMPRSLVIRHIAYKAVRSGLITGVLLAIARMTGETAPLIFTALGNSLFTLDPRGPMSSLPLIIYEFARSPYAEQQKLAWTGALILTFAVLALSIVARALSARDTAEVGSPKVSLMSNEVAAPRPAKPPSASKDKIDVRGLDFYYGQIARAQGGEPVALRRSGDGVHRPVGLRQVDAAARAQPHVRPLSRPARGGRSPARRREHPVARTSTSTCCARASAWCSRSRRRSR